MGCGAGSSVGGSWARTYLLKVCDCSDRCLNMVTSYGPRGPFPQGENSREWKDAFLAVLALALTIQSRGPIF